MKRLRNKIFETIIWLVLLFIILDLGIGFFIGLFMFDDDVIFIYGLTLIVITCLVFMIGFISVMLASIWYKKKKGVKDEYKRN